MEELFLSVLNMSLTASYVILFVILVRMLLKKAPKVISYALWAVVAFRLIVPFSFESMFSFLPRSMNTAPITPDIIYQQSPRINSGIEVVDSFVNKSLPAPTIEASANPLQIYIGFGAYIWILGIVALIFYSVISTLHLKRRLKGSRLIEHNIYEANNLKTPFVLGLIKPRIYLPVGLNIQERRYILLHEQTHIHRKDHIIKILAFLILSLHWFNPLVWIAFMLMNSDMEMSCDEKVLKEIQEDIKKPYAYSLLSLATGKHAINGSPLAFGEGIMKGRIKNVLNYRKPGFWAIALSIILVAAVGIGLMANPRTVTGDKSIISNARDVLKITVETQPGDESSLKMIEDKEHIMDVINYINGLNLKKTDKDPSQYEGMSYIITIYYSNGTSTEYIHFGNRFFKESGSDWYEMPYKQAVKFAGIYKSLSGGDKNSEQNRDAGNEDEITRLAWEYINKDIANYELRQGVKIIDSKITRLELIESFDNLAEAPVEVYALEYRLLPEDLSKVVLAGGMEVDEEGWLKETSSMGKPLMVVLRNGDSVTLIGTLWTAEVRTESEMKSRIRSLLGLTTLEPTTLVPTAPELSPEQTLGVDMAELDYASDDILIFHDYFGLFVYDLNSSGIIRSLDLEPLNCHQTQGDNYCEVSVSMDGNTVHLHPMSSKNMFVYTISDNTLQETIYKPMDNRFGNQFVPIEEVIDSTMLGNYSHHAVLFDTGEYGYLHTEDWTISTLSYVRGDKVFRLFDLKR